MTTQQTETDVRQLRVDIDSVIDKLMIFSPSRELSLVRTKLEEAKMWAGKELRNIGVELPPPYQDKNILDSAKEANQPGDTVMPETTESETPVTDAQASEEAQGEQPANESTPRTEAPSEPSLGSEASA